VIRCIRDGGALKTTLACRQTLSVNGPGAGISELAVRLQSLEQGMPCYDERKPGPVCGNEQTSVFFRVIPWLFITILS
jgi:hypothetical protein